MEKRIVRKRIINKHGSPFTLHLRAPKGICRFDQRMLVNINDELTVDENAMCPEIEKLRKRGKVEIVDDITVYNIPDEPTTAIVKADTAIAVKEDKTGSVTITNDKVTAVVAVEDTNNKMTKND